MPRINMQTMVGVAFIIAGLWVLTQGMKKAGIS